MTDYQTKRIYDAPLASDGRRVLVDRLWPRGVSKQEAALERWDRTLAPSDTLRQWFDHQPGVLMNFVFNRGLNLRTMRLFATFDRRWQPTQR